MSTLKLMLGLIPSTSKIEQEEKALIAELEKMISFASSATLARYNELHESVNSASFKQKRREIESLTYKGSEEYAREKECLSLKKAKDIVLYFKTEGSQPLKNFISLDGSSKIKEIEDLERYIQSPEFRMKEKMKPITFKNTEEYGKWLEYKKLKVLGLIDCVCKACATRNSVMPAVIEQNKCLDDLASRRILHTTVTIADGCGLEAATMGSFSP